MGLTSGRMAGTDDGGSTNIMVGYSRPTPTMSPKSGSGGLPLRGERARQPHEAADSEMSAPGEGDIDRVIDW
jgi:hypothetical protein